MEKLFAEAQNIAGKLRSLQEKNRWPYKINFYEDGVLELVKMLQVERQIKAIEDLTKALNKETITGSESKPRVDINDFPVITRSKRGRKKKN